MVRPIPYTGRSIPMTYPTYRDLPKNSATESATRMLDMRQASGAFKASPTRARFALAGVLLLALILLVSFVVSGAGLLAHGGPRSLYSLLVLTPLFVTAAWLLWRFARSLLQISKGSEPRC